MADQETQTDPTSPVWARLKILMGFIPAIAALGTAITAIVKAYDQSSQKAIYETLGKKVEENAAALQETHSDVKAVWAYLNGMAVVKASVVESRVPSTDPLIPYPVPTFQANPKNTFLEIAKKFSPPPKETPVDEVEGTEPPEAPQVQLNAAQEVPTRQALPDLSPPPKSERLPSFEDMIERPKAIAK